MQMFSSFDCFCPPITGKPKGVIAGYVIEKGEGNICARECAFNVKIMHVGGISKQVDR